MQAIAYRPTTMRDGVPVTIDAEVVRMVPIATANEDRILVEISAKV
jgi:hypothetical protein